VVEPVVDVLPEVPPLPSTLEDAVSFALLGVPPVVLVADELLVVAAVLVVVALLGDPAAMVTSDASNAVDESSSPHPRSPNESGASAPTQP